MRTIYKYPVTIVDEFEVRMPRGAQPLCVQVQNGDPFLWALVDTEAAPVQRVLQVRGTGHPCDGFIASHFVGSFQLHGGALVFHLFDPRIER